MVHSLISLSFDSLNHWDGVKDFASELSTCALTALGSVRAKTRIALVGPATTDFVDDLRIFTDTIASVRVLMLRDAHLPEREAWLAKSFPRHLCYEFAENETASISRMDGDFNVLIIAGNDVTRMRHFLKQNYALLANRVKICLLHDSNARRRARALIAGFDDAFDTARTQPLEAVARCYAIWQRYQTARDSHALATRLNLAMAAVCNVDRISPRQHRALEYLCQCAGRIVTYRQLSEQIGMGEAYISDANLKVIVCLLRKQLKPGCRIVSEHGVGYCLTMDSKLVHPARFDDAA